MHTPRYLVAILAEAAGAIDAGRTRQMMQAAMTPYVSKSDRQGMFRRLGRLADGPAPNPEPAANPAPIVHDPEAASAYFAARGVRVQRAKTS